MKCIKKKCNDLGMNDVCKNRTGHVEIKWVSGVKY